MTRQEVHPEGLCMTYLEAYPGSLAVMMLSQHWDAIRDRISQRQAHWFNLRRRSS